MGTMKAVQVPRAGADFELVEREIPQPSAGQVRIRVRACGVCHGVRPMIEKYPLDKAAEGYARMMSGKAEFRVVLVIGQ